MAIMNLKALRVSSGLSQEQLAVKMGVIRTAVANWEAETSLPMTRDLPALARILGCTINDLFASTGEVNNDTTDADSA